MEDLRASPLDDRHRRLGATMTGFGGWSMPLDYGSVIAEHRAVRESCGVFDLSHLGAVVISGPDATAVAQRAFSNDAAALEVGACQYTLCLDDAAGIVDDLLISRFPWGIWAVPNAANTAVVLQALQEAAAGRDASVTDVGPAAACIAVQGRASPQVLLEAGIDTAGLAYLHGRSIAVGTPADAVGVPHDGAPPFTDPDAAGSGGLLTRTGYTGEVGYEVVLPAGRAGDLWDRLLAAGATPAGLGARDTLRLEMGYPLHGNDLSTDVTPVAARLGWAVAVGTGFRGEQAYVEAKQRGVARRLWGLRALARGVPRAGQRVTRDGEEIGTTTSGTFSPTCSLGIAMGYVDATPGDEVVIDVRGRDLPVEVVRPPFVDADPRG